MLKKLGLPAVVLGALMAFMTPKTAQARDRDRDWHRHFYRGPRFSVYYGPSYGPAYGYYDRWGYWHPYYYPYR